MNNTYNWYSTLIKPSWAPPSWVFGPAWSFLYTLIAISFGRIFWLVYQKQLPGLVALPFVLNIFFNLIFSPLQFGLKNNLLAAIDISLVLITIIWAMIAVYPHVRWIAYIQIPYLLWVSFATTVQFSITYLNK
jgi:translocator protein